MPIQAPDENFSINKRIYQAGPHLFEKLRNIVRENATRPVGAAYSETEHNKNKATLDRAINKNLREADWDASITKAQFWDRAWTKVVYANTRAEKASREIEDIKRRKVPLFQSFENFDDTYRFNKAQWDEFSKAWQRRFFWYRLVQFTTFELREPECCTSPESLGRYILESDAIARRFQKEVRDDLREALDNDRRRRSKYSPLLGSGSFAGERAWDKLFVEWQQRSREYEDWRAFALSHAAEYECSLKQLSKCGHNTLSLMLKRAPFDNLRFSADSAKMQKYVNLAEMVKKHDGEKILERFTGPGFVFEPNHLRGDEYSAERILFWNIHRRFKQYFGHITSLHLMMELGFKTIKPDRVMTYLFSRLGWLVTLPRELGKEEVLRRYMDESVVEEMLLRADVLAASLADAERQPDFPAHRLLDIWFVKYGQEPEQDYGVTVNLAKQPDGLELLQEEVELALASVTLSVTFENQWPSRRFDEVRPGGTGNGVEEGHPESIYRTAAPRATHKRVKVKISRQEAGKRFLEHWRADKTSGALKYPPKMDNAPKENILKLLEKGYEPSEAFAKILFAG